MFRLIFSRRWWWTTLLVLAGAGLSIRLGFWQIGRYLENKAFADHLTSMQAAEPLMLTGGASSAGLVNMEYRSVQVSGTYDFSHQVAVRNQVWTQGWGEDVGFVLVTPLVLSDGSAVLVHRGWIPLVDASRASWQKYDQPGPVTVNGVIRLPARPEMGGQPDPTLAPGQAGLDTWNLVDIQRIQQQVPYPILPVYIQATPDPNRLIAPYRALPEPELPEAGVNIGYTAMWFSFSLLLIIGYPVYLKKQAPGTPAE